MLGQQKHGDRLKVWYTYTDIDEILDNKSDQEVNPRCEMLNSDSLKNTGARYYRTNSWALKDCERRESRI